MGNKRVIEFLEKHNGLTVLYEVEPKGYERRVVCLCKCGTMKEFNYRNLLHGVSKSCGCSRVQHGKINTGAYSSWVCMKSRCNNFRKPDYCNYGGRGIEIDPRWDDFIQFEKDMGPRPKGYSLDRKDTNGNYEPANCRWASRTKQQQNMRNSVIWIAQGVEYATCAIAGKALGVSDRTVVSWCKGVVVRGKFYPPKEGYSFRMKYPEEVT